MSQKDKYRVLWLGFHSVSAFGRDHFSFNLNCLHQVITLCFTAWEWSRWRKMEPEANSREVKKYLFLLAAEYTHL